MKRIILKEIIFTIIFAGFLSITGTCNAATCEQIGTDWYPGSYASQSLEVADVQQCITNGATDGHTIHLKEGIGSWNTPLTWTNKNISIIGAGIDKTILTGTSTNSLTYGTVFDIKLADKAGFRLSQMTITGAVTSATQTAVYIKAENATEALYGFRIDHVKVSYSRTDARYAANIFMFYGGVVWGVIDNCTFEGTGSVKGLAIIQLALFKTGETIHGEYAHSLPVNLGTNEAVYFEDNIVTADKSGFVFNMAYGGNVVVRHNTITGTYMQTHSARSADRGGVKYEIYNNTINGMGHIWPALLRSGTGVIYNNQVTNYTNNYWIIDDQHSNTSCLNSSSPIGVCNGANYLDGNTEGSGWPCLDQIGWVGAAGSQTNIPLYAWNNGAEKTCSTGGTCTDSVTIKLNSACGSSLENYLKTTGNEHTGGYVDYVNSGKTPKSGYTPYTYPHPLRNSTTSYTENTQEPPPTTSVPPTIAVSPTIKDFGTLPINTSSPAQRFTVTTSGGNLNVDDVSMTGTDATQFAIQNDSCTGNVIAPETGSCTFDVKFSPSTVGAKAANVTIVDNDSNTTKLIAVNGTGTSQVPAISFSPTSLSFSGVLSGTLSSPQTIRVSNTSTNFVTISSISLSGTYANQFSIPAATDYCTGETVAASGNCSFQVIFSPTSGGEKTANVNLTALYYSNPATLPLYGSAVVYPAPKIKISRTK